MLEKEAPKLQVWRGTRLTAEPRVGAGAESARNDAEQQCGKGVVTLRIEEHDVATNTLGSPPPPTQFTAKQRSPPSSTTPKDWLIVFFFTRVTGRSGPRPRFIFREP